MTNIKTFLINLPRSHERRSAMKAQLSLITSIDLTIVKAVDGKSLTTHDLSVMYDKEKAKQYLYRDMTATEIGCALSHFECYRQLLASNSAFSLILEDDVVISNPSFLSDYYALAEIMDSPTPTILLCTPDVVIKRHRQSFIQNKIAIAEYFSGVYAAGYIINRAAAHYLLQQFYPVYCLADSWRLLKNKTIAMWALLEPAIIFHSLADISTIERKRYKPVKRRKTLMESSKDTLYRYQKKLGLMLHLLTLIR